MLAILHASVAIWSGAIMAHPAVSVRSPMLLDTVPGVGAVQPRPVITPQIDSQGVRILKAANAKLGATQSLTGRILTNYRALAQQKSQRAPQVRVQRLSVLKPGYVKVEDLSSANSTDSVTAMKMCTPKGRWEYDSYRPDTAVYFTECGSAWWFVPSVVRGVLDSPGLIPQVGEWNENWLKHPLFESIRYLGRKEWNGSAYDVVEWVYSRAAELPETQDLYTSQAYVGINDTIIHRVVTTQVTNGKTVYEVESVLEQWKMGSPLTVADFAVPYKNIKNYNWQAPKPSDFLNKPWFALAEPARLLDGREIKSIDDLVRGKKGVVLWAWSTSCSACVEEFPLMEQLRLEYEPKGIVIVAVDPGSDEERAAAQRYMVYNRSAMSVIFNAGPWTEVIYTKGLISAVIDENGTVVSAGGANIEGIRAKLDELTLPSIPARQN